MAQEVVNVMWWTRGMKKHVKFNSCTGEIIDDEVEMNCLGKKHLRSKGPKPIQPPAASVREAWLYSIVGVEVVVAVSLFVAWWSNL